MTARIAITLALLFTLVGCGSDTPSTERVGTVLQELNRLDVKKRRDDIAAAPGGGLVSHFANLPRPEEVEVQNVNIIETKDAEDGGLWVTATYDVLIRGITYNEKNSLLMTQRDEKWIAIDAR